MVDYEVGNTHSIWNAIRTLGYSKLKLSADQSEILSADALILPGVGSFASCAENLRRRHLDDILNRAVLEKKKPILGICVGMQLMATVSEENGKHAGLGWIPGQVVKIDLPPEYAVPHVGWNEINTTRPDILFSRTPESPHFYFDHSYHYRCDEQYVTAKCNYGMQVTAAIARDHIYGVQFHPEKSQVNGLKLFRAFFSAITQC
ncbi:imidazole glycerol phosphate synthase subunit HisH [bacterium]|nr:imidazole glycerol phosphate synthase subunit HisH [bacterium]